MKKLLCLLIVITALFVTITIKGSDNAIIIYASTEQFRNDELQEQLIKRFPDKDIRVVYVSTAKAATKIKIEGTTTDADIVVGLETAYLEKIKDNLADVSDKSSINYTSDLFTSNKYVIWERQAGSIIINNRVLKKHNLPVPSTYEDLLNPVYKNYIAMPDPKSSGTGYFFYKGLVNKMGEKKALEYFDKLQGNIKQFTESGSGPIKLLKQEEIAIGLGLTFQGVNEKNEGYDFTLIEPEFGSPYSLTGSSMIKGRENDEDIQEVFDFIINEFLVYDKENFSPEVIYKGQVNKIKNYPTNIKYADMSGIEKIEEKERLLDLWKY